MPLARAVCWQGRPNRRNSATEDKLPRQVLPGTYRHGFSNTLMHKDQRLYLQAVAARGCPAEIARVNAALWESFAAAEPGADFTRIYLFVQGTIARSAAG